MARCRWFKVSGAVALAAILVGCPIDVVWLF